MTRTTAASRPARLPTSSSSTGSPPSTWPMRERWNGSFARVACTTRASCARCPVSIESRASALDESLQPAERGVPLIGDVPQVLLRVDQTGRLDFPNTLASKSAGVKKSSLLHALQVLGDRLARD